MKSWFLGMSAVAALMMAAGASAQDKKPINTKCPVKGDPAKPDITAEYEGKVIAFC
jgi:hypothetical protein